MSYGETEPHPRTVPPPRLPQWAAPGPADDPPDGEPACGTHPRAGHHGDLRRLRRSYRRQRRVTTFLALGYFTAFLVLSAREPALMARPLPFGLPLGLVLALSHVPVTWLAVLVYERTARRYVDPLALVMNGPTAPHAGTGRASPR